MIRTIRAWRRRQRTDRMLLFLATSLLGVLLPAVPAGSSAPVSRIAFQFSASLPEVADGKPAYLAHVATPGGTRDLLFVTTRDGRIVALDAHSGRQIWERQHGPGTCRINRGDTPCYTTSSPAVDPDGRYVYSYGLDGAVHKYRVEDGSEISAQGWPEIVSRKGFDEKGSSDLVVATARDHISYLYMASGGYPGDRGDYQGHLTTINLATGTQHVFNAVCSNQAVHFVERPLQPDCAAVQTAIWARAGVVYDPATDRIYVATGNGVFDPGTHSWSESVLALHPDGTGSGGDPLDSFTPKDFKNLTDRDADLGSTGPVILPNLPGSHFPNVAVQGGKDALLRLLNLDNLSGTGKIGHTGGELGSVIPVPQGGVVLSTPVIWSDPHTHAVWVFVANASGISGLRVLVRNGVPQLFPVWKHGGGGFSPIVARTVLLYAGSNNLWALDPRTGLVIGDTRLVGYIHWESPLVVGNTVYISDSNARLSAFALS